MEPEKHKEPIVKQWVSNYVGIMVFNMFAFVIIVTTLIAWHQITRVGEYAAEFSGMINYMIVSFMTIFISVMGVLFGISQKEMRENATQQSKISKEVGADNFVKMQLEKLEASPDVDTDEVK